MGGVAVEVDRAGDQRLGVGGLDDQDPALGEGVGRRPDQPRDHPRRQVLHEVAGDDGVHLARGEALDVGDRILAAHLEALLLDQVDEVRLGVDAVGRHPRVAHQLQQLAPPAPEVDGPAAALQVAPVDLLPLAHGLLGAPEAGLERQVVDALVAGGRRRRRRRGRRSGRRRGPAPLQTGQARAHLQAPELLLEPVDPPGQGRDVAGDALARGGLGGRRLLRPGARVARRALGRGDAGVGLAGQVVEDVDQQADQDLLDRRQRLPHQRLGRVRQLGPEADARLGGRRAQRDARSGRPRRGPRPSPGRPARAGPPPAPRRR